MVATIIRMLRIDAKYKSGIRPPLRGIHNEKNIIKLENILHWILKFSLYSKNFNGQPLSYITNHASKYIVCFNEKCCAVIFSLDHSDIFFV